MVALGRAPYTGFLGTLTREDDQAVQQAIDAVGASALASRPVVELSDGERQKLLIARALAQQTPLILLDEPTAFLDAPRRVEILTLLRDIAHDADRAIIVSTHEVTLALELADWLWLMDDSGNFAQGTPRDVLENGAFQAAFPTLRVG
jgi:iron complex transport system ATP-binding protein